ncbi:hypothetical protein [Streptomyces sp. OR43]|uniref:hypothetical protein n=1 Tax=Streptomyces sp. or43 TaxID=2478957 RepID=UPI0011CE004A|nr:hypothetical protein [Streptomyces sp. or43]TXS43673.1 hypothetical protein EAO72_11055 [Streptomyces sp. or43]
MGESMAAVLAALIGVFGALGGTLVGVWMQRRAAAEQIAAQERAERRAQLRADRRASYAEVIDASERFIASLDDIVAVRRGASPADRPSEQWAEMREESQAAMRMLRRAIWNARVSGPEPMADLAKRLYDVNMHRFKVAFDDALSFDEVDEQLSVKNADFRRTRSEFVAGAQQILGNGSAAERQARTPTRSP